MKFLRNLNLRLRLRNNIKQLNNLHIPFTFLESGWLEFPPSPDLIIELRLYLRRSTGETRPGGQLLCPFSNNKTARFPAVTPFHRSDVYLFLKRNRVGAAGVEVGGCVGGRGELLAAVLSNNVTQSALSLSSQRDSLIRSRSTS